MTAIYKKEMRTYFTHMMGYVFLAIMLLLFGIFFSTETIGRHNPNFHMVLLNITTFFFVLVPVLTMRLFSEEARQKTDQLLFTSPLSVMQIVLGKFLAAFSLFFIATVLTITLPLMVSGYGELPVSQIVGTYAAFLLIGAASIAVGVFISVLTDNQIIAAIATMGAIFVMFIMETVALLMPVTTLASLVFVGVLILGVAGILYNSTKNIIVATIVALLGAGAVAALYFTGIFAFDGIIIRVLQWLSIYARFNNFALGILNVGDIVYYISFAALFVYLTANVIEKRRWR